MTHSSNLFGTSVDAFPPDVCNHSQVLKPPQP